MPHTYVFVLSPPYSGSTVLYRLIGSSANAATLFGHGNWAGEGQFLPSAVSIMRAKGVWNPAVVMPWGKIKEEWDKHWDLTKPILVEKSPPNICRAAQIEDYFAEFGEVYFVALIRNPYACTQRPDVWLMHARYQENNIKSRKNILWMTYESLCDHTEVEAKRLSVFIPRLGDLDPTRNVDGVVGERADAIANKNLYTKSLVRKRNETLAAHEDLLRFFGYSLIDPETIEAPRPEVEVEHTIEASPALIFDAWTSTQALGCWWSNAELDPVGGRYKLTTSLPAPSGGEREVVLTGRYVDARKDAVRLVLSIDPGSVDNVVDESQVEIEIHATGPRSRIVVRHLQIPRALFGLYESLWEAQLRALESYLASE